LAADRRLELNRSWWDERVPIHVGSAFYDVDGFRAGGSTLRPFEREEVGDVTGKRLAHLQCHFGLDTLSWARAGASVAGLDFSGPAIDAATALADETGLDARFVQADVYDALEALGGERFDIVYTGLGALNWLPDLPRWAGVVASLLAEDGFLYLAEFHPATWVFGDHDYSIEWDYFHDPEGVSFDDDEPGSYADLEVPTRNNATREWAHTLADVITAVLGAGLRLELVSEHDYTLFPRFDDLELDEGFLTAGVVYRQPAGKPRLPLMYSLRARRERGLGISGRCG
jgi:SAM-dependent methyltransferase